MRSGNLITTAMGVMPHTDVDRTPEMAMSLDVPFWPQLPNYNFFEDMYVQASENFPGIILDIEKRTIKFSKDKFYQELPNVIENFENEEIFDVSAKYSVVYPKFLELDLSSCPAIRGQMEGPISFGFNIVDQDDRPILFDDELRSFLYEFMAKSVNVQLKRLKEKNENAFMFIDEPGLQFLFSALSGYSDVFARQDIDNFLTHIERPRGIHLCGNPDWDFLFGFDMEIASIDIYTNQKVIPLYGNSIKKFLDRGGTIVWGIVPTHYEAFEKEELDNLKKLLKNIWETVLKYGIDKDELLSKSMLSPATCFWLIQIKKKVLKRLL